MDRLSHLRFLAVAVGGLVFAYACSNDPPTALPPSSTVDAGAAADDAAAVISDDASAVVNDDAATTANDGGAAEEDGGAAEAPTWCGQVRPIVSTKCALCHGVTPAFGAPMSLVSYADVRVRNMVGIPIHERMATRVTAPSSRMPPPNQTQLTPEETEMVVRWSSAGAPEGDCTVTPDAGVSPDAADLPDAGPPPNTFPLEFRVHAPGTPGTPYALPVDNTNYRCWAFTIPMGAPEQYIVRFEHLIDNMQYLHHTLIFRNRNANSPDGPFGCGSPELTWDMVSGWAPGQPDESMPPGVGVRAFPGDQFIIQAHYDQVRTGGNTDESGVRFLMTDQPGLQESAVLWAGGAWNPAISGNNVMRRGQCNVRTGFTMFSVFPHMHKLGTRITLEIQRQGSSNWEMVGEVPAWSFDDQPKIAVPMPFQAVAAGDKIRTTCWWDTMGRSVNFGEASDDEMCFNFINHYPALSNPTLACLMFMQ